MLRCFWWLVVFDLIFCKSASKFLRRGAPACIKERLSTSLYKFVALLLMITV